MRWFRRRRARVDGGNVNDRLALGGSASRAQQIEKAQRHDGRGKPATCARASHGVRTVPTVAYSVGASGVCYTPSNLKLRTYFATLAAVTLVPLLALAVAVVLLALRDRHASVEHGLQERAVTLAVADGDPTSL